jgi:hypothetical protein
MNIIAGGGKYGCEAVEYHRSRKIGFVLVDKDPECLAVKRYNLKTCKSLNYQTDCFFQGDMSTVLKLLQKYNLTYLFPTAPIHVAAELAKLKFNLRPWTEAINLILSKLPPSIVLKSGRGNLILSYNRDEDCIDKCGTPPICPSTNKSKPCTMDNLMRFAYPQGFFLVSYQMAPGMGALKITELLKFFNSAEEEEKFVVATTCDCHGVFSAFCKD